MSAGFVVMPCRISSRSHNTSLSNLCLGVSNADALQGQKNTEIWRATLAWWLDVVWGYLTIRRSNSCLVHHPIDIHSVDQDRQIDQ